MSFGLPQLQETSIVGDFSIRRYKDPEMAPITLSESNVFGITTMSLTPVEARRIARFLVEAADEHDAQEISHLHLVAEE
jgi:hypothetical protein